MVYCLYYVVLFGVELFDCGLGLEVYLLCGEVDLEDFECFEGVME